MNIISRLIILTSVSLSLLACTTEVVDSKVQAPDFTKASEINVQLALNYLQQGDMARAKQKLLLALSQDPNSATANGAMAYYSERTQDIKTAETYYKKAIALADVKGGAENNYGTFLCRQKRYEQANDYFQQAAVDANYLTPDKAYVNAGVCALLIPNKKKAAHYFQQALEKDPNSTPALLALAKLENEKNHFLAANTHLVRYLSLEQADAPTLWLAIGIAQKLKDRDAVKAYGAELKNRFPDTQEYQQYQQLSPNLAIG